MEICSCGGTLREILWSVCHPGPLNMLAKPREAARVTATVRFACLFVNMGSRQMSSTWKPPFLYALHKGRQYAGNNLVVHHEGIMRGSQNGRLQKSSIFCHFAKRFFVVVGISKSLQVCRTLLQRYQCSARPSKDRRTCFREDIMWTSLTRGG